MIIRPILSPFIILCMLSCSNPRDRGPISNPDSSYSSIAGGSPSGRTAPDFKTLHAALGFAGTWVNEIYVDSIRKNRSPRQDQQISESCINIPDSTLKTTSMISGFHEGGTEIVIVKDGNRYQFYDPEFKTPKDIIEPISPTRLRIGNQYFQKLKYPDMDKYEWGILNEILFSGKYKSQDGKKIVFGMDGHIDGLDTVAYYQPHADYTGEQELDVDRISLGQSRKNTHEYGFRFDKDTLLIYRIDCVQYDSMAHECGLEKLGELRWRLQRVPDL
jgi:hypothetical protein